MKKFLYKISSGPQFSFTCLKESLPYFYDEFHYHPQLELNLIVKGSGMRFVGDNIEKFSAGDVVLLGRDLPHVWKCDPSYYSNKRNRACESITIHFLPDFLGHDFFEHPELLTVKELIKNSAKGLKLIGQLRTEVAESIVKMTSQNYPNRLVSLLEVLIKISVSKETVSLSKQGPLKAMNEDGTRIIRITNYIKDNFKTKITLEDVARIAFMSRNAFCRFFKQNTRKSFSQFLTEIRVAHACELLQENKLKIEHVCFESGFSNISNFNRHFKKQMKTTPYEYQKTMSLLKPSDLGKNVVRRKKQLLR